MKKEEQVALTGLTPSLKEKVLHLTLLAKLQFAYLEAIEIKCQ